MLNQALLKSSGINELVHVSVNPSINLNTLEIQTIKSTPYLREDLERRELEDLVELLGAIAQTVVEQVVIAIGGTTAQFEARILVLIFDFAL